MKTDQVRITTISLFTDMNKMFEGKTFPELILDNNNTVFSLKQTKVVKYHLSLQNSFENLEKV